ncbi:MAG: rRNA maturation RNase YbeY [Rhizobiales bacterium]|nr:rRNA maturation RNase YbeY [Hyphomicrobiales bacterium]NRB15251.1 rRNA maturation RNase YbeY [Hyphomicrobiales bacterium]
MNELTAEINLVAKQFADITDLDILVKQACGVIAQQDQLKTKPHGEFGLMLCDDAKIQELNQQFRQKDQATNVLSFPAQIDDYDELFDNAEVYLGDIAMAFESLQQEALSQNKPIAEHFSHLLIHSILHLLGYDHIIATDAEHMESLEIKLLAMLDIENPYD